MVMNLFLLLLSLPLVASSSVAPWQSVSSTVNDEKVFLRLGFPRTTFNSQGRLVVLEHIIKQASSKADQSANLLVALRYNGGIVVLTSGNKSPYLDTDDEADHQYPLLLPQPPSFQVGPQLYSATAGNAVDCQLLKEKTLQISAQLWEGRNAGFGIQARLPASLLARTVADFLHRPTQSEVDYPMLAAYAVVFDADELWRIDITGQFWKCRGAVLGKNSREAESWLVTKIQEEPKIESLSEEKAIELARDCIRAALPDHQTSRIHGIVVSGSKRRLIQSSDAVLKQN